jgi:alkaline phosphatase D
LDSRNRHSAVEGDLLGVENPSATRTVEGPELSTDSGLTSIVKLDELKPATRYQYEVILGDRSQTLRPSPAFKTAPEPNQPIKLRIALGSCVGETIADAAPAWADLAGRQSMKPEQGAFDLLLMLGDNHYANTSAAEKQRVYYTAHRLTAAWRELAAQSPIYAIWDDHDFGPDNSDSTLKGKEDSLRIFKEYWANPSCGEPDNPGCYFTFSRGDVQFFMLDCRYYRSPNKAPDGPEKTMLGAKQLEWLKRELSSEQGADQDPRDRQRVGNVFLRGFVEKLPNGTRRILRVDRGTEARWNYSAQR